MKLCIYTQNRHKDGRIKRGGLVMSKTIEELEKEFERLAEEIKQIKENSKENKRWRAEKEENYYTILSHADIHCIHDLGDGIDNNRYSIGNYFQTQEQAENVAEKLRIYAKLKDLALRLNNGEKIDWDNDEQSKWYIYYDFSMDEVYTDGEIAFKEIGQVYCLDKNFKEKALEEIGEENLKKLFEEE